MISKTDFRLLFISLCAISPSPPPPEDPCHRDTVLPNRSNSGRIVRWPEDKKKFVYVVDSLSSLVASDVCFAPLGLNVTFEWGSSPRPVTTTTQRAGLCPGLSWLACGWHADEDSSPWERTRELSGFNPLGCCAYCLIRFAIKSLIK